MKTVIEKVEEVLSTRYAMSPASSLTHAVACIIFNTYASWLVSRSDFEPSKFADEIKSDMVRYGVNTAIQILEKTMTTLPVR